MHTNCAISAYRCDGIVVANDTKNFTSSDTVSSTENSHITRWPSDSIATTNNKGINRVRNFVLTTSNAGTERVGYFILCTIDSNSNAVINRIVSPWNGN